MFITTSRGVATMRTAEAASDYIENTRAEIKSEPSTTFVLLSICTYRNSHFPSVWQINGQVTFPEVSLPVKNVILFVKGTEETAGLQADGSFTLAASPDSNILVLSLDGFEKKEIRINKPVDHPLTVLRSFVIRRKQ